MNQFYLTNATVIIGHTLSMLEGTFSFIFILFYIYVSILDIGSSRHILPM